VGHIYKMNYGIYAYNKKKEKCKSLNSKRKNHMSRLNLLYDAMIKKSKH